MKPISALTLLAVVALLTPIAAMLGLYDTSADQVMRFVAPAIGAGSAIFFFRLFSGRRS
ncbi:MAG TPA: hypothetical protein VEA81_07190 [Burkholderiaceae bacterium]|nr:hypothetical protein [Burkholderiaceae bacterium]